jgi:hypothetical protein
MFSRSPGSGSHVSGSDISTTSDMQALRNQVQWLTELVSQQQYITPMRDALSGADHVDSVVSMPVVVNTASVATAATVDVPVVDHTAAVATSVGTSAGVDKSTAVAVVDDKVDQCYKGIAVLDAYHKEINILLHKEYPMQRGLGSMML